MSQQSYLPIRGYVAAFSIRKAFDDRDVASFDVEIVVAHEWRSSSPTITVRFSDARDIRYGDAHQGIDLGAYLFLNITDVTGAGWDGIRFRADNVEQGCLFSLHCRSFEVLDA